MAASKTVKSSRNPKQVDKQYVYIRPSSEFRLGVNMPPTAIISSTTGITWKSNVKVKLWKLNRDLCRLKTDH